MNLLHGVSQKDSWAHYLVSLESSGSFSSNSSSHLISAKDGLTQRTESLHLAFWHRNYSSWGRRLKTIQPSLESGQDWCCASVKTCSCLGCCVAISPIKSESEHLLKTFSCLETTTVIFSVKPWRPMAEAYRANRVGYQSERSVVWSPGCVWTLMFFLCIHWSVAVCKCEVKRCNVAGEVVRKSV